MKKTNWLLGFILFILGFFGVLSLLTVDFSSILDTLPQDKLDQIPEELMDILLLINPTLFLGIAVIFGTLFHKKVNLEVPTIQRLLGDSVVNKITFLDQVKFGIPLGIVSGLLISLVMFFGKQLFPEVIEQMNNSVEMGFLPRLLYGGITEEILLRFGFMSTIVWLLNLISKKPSPWIYWLGIIISSAIFALGHFPAVGAFMTDPTPLIYLVVFVGNTIGGLIFGWLYWRKGLESAFVAHAFTHLTMVPLMALA